MKYIYLYVDQTKVNDAIKYGMKLSEYTNKIFDSKIDKKGILGFLSPQDSDFFDDKNFTCLKIKTENLKIYIYNEIFENTDKLKKHIVELSKYTIGDFEEPRAIICSTILPENISLYNKYLDTPLLIENSKEYYYEKSIHNFLDSGYFTNYELYQMLLILGSQKNLFSVENVNKKVKVYKNKLNNKTYTKKNNF